MDLDTRAALEAALRTLLAKDTHLLREDVCERSLTHRLAVHLAPHFPDWDIDCEYNRKGFGKVAKRLNWRLDTDPEWEPPRIFPDIIVHRRGQARNLLVVEVKKSTANYDSAADQAKLAAFTTPEGPQGDEGLGYEAGAFVILNTGVSAPSFQIAAWLPAQSYHAG